uniref:Ferritin n=1 Tax=Heterorhabditis bacteriophora TaxID=37862 RepID=A0A1I7XG04_HETBA
MRIVRAEEFLNAWTVFKPNEKDTSAELVSHFDKQLEMYQLCSELLADGKLDTDELVLRINKHVIQDLKLMYDWMLDNMDMVSKVVFLDNFLEN